VCGSEVREEAMTETPLDKHIEAARREVRVHAWKPSQVEVAWQELGKRRQRREVRIAQARRVALRGLALAAAALLVFGATRLFEPAPPAAQAPAKASDPRRLALDDGIEASFDKAELDVVERTKERIVVRLQAGKAQFHVRHDPGRVFRVQAGDVRTCWSRISARCSPWTTRGAQ
jgi:ferric-dicitrate binding protein FerR (iron transport regulator)